MGYTPAPIQPIPPDATPEERMRILQEYRTYLERSLDRTNADLQQALFFIIAVIAFIVLVG